MGQYPRRKKDAKESGTNGELSLIANGLALRVMG